MSLTFESIELIDFDRMALNGIRRFKLTLDKMITLILGRNGCGKSSLLEQLTLMCPDKDDYSTGGGRIIWFVYNGRRYQSSCMLKGKSFKCTISDESGHVYCDNVNPKVYHLTIEDMFNFNRVISDIITGRYSITSMNTTERRKLFTAITESDLTYALKFYNKAKSKLRDSVGTTKWLKKEIGTLKTQIINDADDMLATKERIETIKGEIVKLDEQIQYITSYIPTIKLSPDSAEKQLETLNGTMLSIDVHYPTLVSNVEPGAIQSEIARIDGSLSQMSEQLEDLDSRIRTAKEYDATDVDALNRELETINTSLTEWTAKCAPFDNLLSLNEDTLTMANNHYENLTGTLYNYINTLMPYNDIIADCGQQLDVKFQERNKVLAERDRIGMQCKMLREEIEQLKAVQDVTCDNCGNIFKPGHRNVTVEDNTEKLNTLIAYYDDLDTQHKTLSEEVTRLNEAKLCKDKVFSQIHEMSKYPAYNKLLVQLHTDTEKWTVFNMTVISSTINRFGEALTWAVRINDYKARATKLKSDIEIAVATQVEDIDALTKKYNQVSDHCSELQRKRNLLVTDMNTYTRYMDNLNRVKDVGEKIQSLSEEWQRGHVKQTCETIIRNLTEQRDSWWTVLAEANKRFNEMDSQRKKLSMMEQQLEDSTASVERLNKIVKAMSPDEGLLSKYLYQSIRRIVSLMSEFISHIWGYEMKVLPCDIEDGELDYKFPYVIPSGGVERKDIAKSSSAQLGVFDFVFILATYRVMGLKGYPLKADETLSAFDDGHRDSAINFIKTIVARGDHSQSLMVSHDADTHFKLTNADNVVIDPEGIVLPPEYNVNVEIDY